MTLVRTDALRGYRELVSELGGEADALLESARIAPAALADPENFVPYVAVIRLLEVTARALGCPDFGLRLSQRQDIGILGPLAVAVQNSSNVGEALTCASRYMYVHSPAIAFSVRPAASAERVLVVFEILLERVPSAVQVTELSVGLAARVLELLGEGRVRLTGARFPHPRIAPLARYRAHFGAPVSFASDCAALELLEADLALPIQSRSRALRDLAADYLEVHYAAPPSPFAVRVRGIVRRSLGTGRSGCDDVASALALHPRTLQRRLRAEGTSFDRIKDDARADLLRRYLAQGELPVSQVAALLEYGEQSALTRSCRRWFGQPPRALRAALLSPNGLPEHRVDPAGQGLDLLGAPRRNRVAKRRAQRLRDQLAGSSRRTSPSSVRTSPSPEAQANLWDDGVGTFSIPFLG